MLIFIQFLLFQRLPLHIACDNIHNELGEQNSPPKYEEVIQALLDVDTKTVMEKTREGRLPLHIAVENKAPESVIDLLIRADDHRKESIYFDFKGMVRSKAFRFRFASYRLFPHSKSVLDVLASTSSCMLERSLPCGQTTLGPR